MAKKELSIDELQNKWKFVIQNLLPEAARSSSPAQSQWPVRLDHCFARIILDHTVGISTPWTSKIKSPAYKNMSREELEASICLGRKILEGKADLVDLNLKSLQLRGKGKKGAQTTRAIGDSVKLRRERGDDIQQARTNEVLVKQEGDDDTAQSQVDEPLKVHDLKWEREGGVVEADPRPSRTRKDADVASASSSSSSPLKKDLPNERSPYFPTKPHKPPAKQMKEDFTPWLKKIALSHKTPFQKKVLSLLCQIPRGRYTTYAAISKHLSSSPRGVGSAIRNNPFAPHVPCHRVLATGGGIGGFHGSWGRNGKAGLNDDKKRKLLRDEGVRFDGSGKVVGGVWEGFN